MAVNVNMAAGLLFGICQRIKDQVQPTRGQPPPPLIKRINISGDRFEASFEGNVVTVLGR